MSFWKRYVPVAERRAKAARKIAKLKKQGRDIQPVEVEGRAIARSFWGKSWCEHLESFSDYSNRLPRGRTYVRNGSVCHLDIQPGRIEAMVAGSSLYSVSIGIKELPPTAWKRIKKACTGQIGSMLELLQGKLSDQVMAVVSDRAGGLFPKPNEIELSCSCPDWAVMCKHVASVLYGVGNRLDSEPELLFLLRNVDAQELIAAEMALPAAGETTSDETLADDALTDIFGIDLDIAPAETAEKPRRKSPRRKKAPSSRQKKTQADQGLPVRSGRKQTRSSPRPSKARARLRPTAKSVARLRKRSGLSVPDFAAALNVSPASVYRWEAAHGSLRLRPSTLAALTALREKLKAQ